MSTSLTIREYQEGDEKQITILLSSVFNGWPKQDISCSSEEFWRWKYHDSPAGRSYVYVALDGEEVIGCHHMMPSNVLIGGEVVKSVTSVDLAVHVDYRGMGLMSDISVPNEDMAESEGVKFNYFITRNPLMIKTFTSSKDLSKRRSRFPVDIRNHVRIIDIEKQLENMPMDNSFIIKTGLYALRTINAIKNTIAGDTKKVGEFELKELNLFGLDADKLWDKVKKNYAYIAERKRDFLNWRYCDPRLDGFEVKGAYDKRGELLGYIVFKINRYRESYPIGYIVDLIYHEDRKDIADALLKESLNYFDSKNINLINCQHPKGNNLEVALNRNGFLDSRVNIQMFYNTYGGFKELNSKNFNPHNVYVSWGDHDALPIKM
jgi:predicted N-acetyltransferase YhbS